MLKETSSKFVLIPEAPRPVHEDELGEFYNYELPRPIVNSGRSFDTAKRVFDILACLLILAIVLPLLVIIAILVRVDSKGPVIYSSNRLGIKGRLFPCFKFRTMHMDAEERLQELLSNDDLLRSEYEIYHKLQSDPRITRFGAFLRRSSLDELPQLINVLLGHMSLIGPRPYLLREASKMVGFIDVILDVRPGLTGYWQVEGRGTSTFSRRLEMDFHYIQHRSFRLDFKIMIRTAIVVIKKSGAY